MPRNDRSRLAVELQKYQQEMEWFTDSQAIGLEEYIEKILGLHVDNMSLRYINYLHADNARKILVGD